MISRRSFGGLAVWAAILCGLAAPAALAQDDDTTSRANVLRDPDIPVLGNPDGDITIVEYFDYQCPYCKTAAVDLAKVIKEDGHIRLVMKDWPILGDPSPYAARLVLATKFQGKYDAAFHALIARVGRLTPATIDETLKKAGVDVARAKSDLAANKAAIEALLKRNDAQAEAFGFQGTPSFIIGTFRVPTALTAEQIKLAIADARARAKADKDAEKEAEGKAKKAPAR